MISVMICCLFFVRHLKNLYLLISHSFNFYGGYLKISLKIIQFFANIFFTYLIIRSLKYKYTAANIKYFLHFLIAVFKSNVD